MNHRATLPAVCAICSVFAFMVGRMTSDPDSKSSSEPQRIAIGPRAASVAGSLATGLNADNDPASRRSKLSPEQASLRISSIMNAPNHLRATKEWLRFVNGLGPEDIEDAVVNFRARGLSRFNPDHYAMLLSTWAKFDPVAALEYASLNTDTNFGQQAILTAWATTDPDGALTWVRTNYDGESANPLLPGVIRGMAKTDPKRASELLAAMPYPAPVESLLDTTKYSIDFREALLSVQAQYLKQGPNAARAWATSLMGEELRKAAMEQVTLRLSYSEPKLTAEWLLDNQNEASTDSICEVMKRLAQTDPEAAIAYLDEIEDEATKTKIRNDVPIKTAGE